MTRRVKHLQVLICRLYISSAVCRAVVSAFTEVLGMNPSQNGGQSSIAGAVRSQPTGIVQTASTTHTHQVRTLYTNVPCTFF